MLEKKWTYEEYVRPGLAKLIKAIGLDVEYVRGSGDYLYYINDDGKEVGVLDMAGGMGSTILGHNNPEIKKVIENGLKNDVPMHAQGSMRESAGKLAKKLSELYPGEEKRIVFFANSGAECVECALKHAELNRVLRLQKIGKDLYRNYKDMKEYFRMHSNLKLPKVYRDRGPDALLNDIILQARILEEMRPIVISTERSFHGKTSSALKVTGNSMYRQAFEGLSALDVKFVEFNNIEELTTVLDDCYFTLNKIVVENGVVRIVRDKHLNVTAFILEPIQGEGGINIATADYIRGIKNLRKKHGFEWIVDEIQTGMGRTGKFLALEHYHINKDHVDYVLLSKSLGGATNKIGAVLIKESIHDPQFGILHTSTFTEDAPSCNVALKSLELLTKNKNELMVMAGEKGDYLMDGLKAIKKKYPSILKEIRGRGLIIGVEFTLLDNSQSLFFTRTAAQGVFGSVLSGYLFHEHNIRTAPPLNSLVSARPSNIIRIEPSAFISKEDMDRVLFGIERACEIISKSNAYEFSKYVVGKATPGVYGEIKDYFKAAVPVEEDPAFEESARMAFLIHPLDIHQVMEDFDPSLDSFTRNPDPITGVSEREAYWDRLVPLMDSFVYRVVNVKSPRTGDRVKAHFIVFMYTTQQMVQLRKTDPQLLIDGVQKAVDLGTKLGAEVCGLGAFTSIVTHNGTDMDDTYIRITSGNSYTSALIWQSVLKAAQYADVDLNKCTCAVVGAGGNIGSVSASLLSEDVPRMILIGSRKSQTIEKLRSVAETMYCDTVDVIRSTKPENLKGLPAAIAGDIVLPYAILNTNQYRFNESAISDYIDSNYTGTDRKIGHLIKSIFHRRPDSDIGEKLLKAVQAKHGTDPYIILTDNMKKYLPECDVVVSAVSADRSIIDASWFKPGAILNDVSLPTSISNTIYKERPDVIATQGGIAHLPEYINLGIPGLAAGAALGCMAETFILSMMNMINSYSYGDISKQQVVKIWEAGCILGFGLAAIKYQGNKKLTREMAKEIRRRV